MLLTDFYREVQGEMRMMEEFEQLPEEYSCPTGEWTPPIRERVFSMEKCRGEQNSEEIRTQPPKRRLNIRRQMKAYAMSIVAVVTVAATLSTAPAPEWDLERVDRELSDYHFAYYAQSADEIETYLENEMWYQFFGKLGDHETLFCGMYGRDDGPTQAFRDALKVSEVLRPDSAVLGLPYYQYQLLLWDGPSPEEDVWSFGDVIVLERPDQVVVSYREQGEERFGFVEAEYSGGPIGEQIFRCNFDITIRDDGEPEADIRVFGNGVDIVGTFEQDLLSGNDSYKLVHATDEHSNNACGRGLSYIIRIVRD